MKRLLKAGAITLSLLLAAGVSTYAQNATTSKVNTDGRPSGVLLSVGPEVGLPVGSLKDGYNWSMGGSVQAELPIVKKSLYVLLNAGYNNFFAKDDIAGAKDLQLIPVKAGLKFYAYKGLYVQGSAGASFVANKSDVGATKSTAFVYSPQIGYLIPLGKNNYLDAGVKFESTAKLVDGGSNSNFFGVRVAYGLNL
ncbi:hypothetical protein SAMN05421788_10450 [Filimonas lacunae]|uniref:Outer membrane protein beta-barrel domain-containing protein n=1 Tax=Filimonas lacunae TaxID=477680 RepID=A0A1N7PTX1_9BACT|nr:hypothetical protein [Filimonas lacunae]SIT14012.1 hypothetical protein SAMN05421788_10450 [Filimonas lacunae]